MPKFIFGLIPLMALSLFGARASAGPILDVDATGQLLGASNVSVGNLGLFDVEFLDGTCAEVFSGCDELADFTFQTRDNAVTAALSLLDTVLLDTTLGAFDTSPTLTRGCVSGITCQINHGYFDAELTAQMTTRNHEAVDDAGSVPLTLECNTIATIPLCLLEIQLLPTFEITVPVGDTSQIDGMTWARWSPSLSAPQEIPEPGSLALLALGLAGLCITRRKRLKQG